MSEVKDHILHSILLGVVLYFAMVYLLKQSKEKACARSTILASVALIYMVMFGHSFPPVKINPNLGF